MQSIKPIGASNSHHNHHLNHAAKETHCLVGIHIGTQLTTHDLPMTHLHASKPTTHIVTLNHPSPLPRKPSTTHPHHHGNPPPHQTHELHHIKPLIQGKIERKKKWKGKEGRERGRDWISELKKKKKKKKREWRWEYDWWEREREIDKVRTE